MSLSKPALLFLVVLLMAPSTAAWAEPCDEALVSRAVLTPRSKRIQLAATQLVTKEMYDRYRSNALTSRIELLDRSLADFNSYEALVDWRRLEASKDFFEFGPDSARAAILAAGEDFFSGQWKKCQLDELMKQPLPAFRGWLDKVEPEQVTVKLVVSVDPSQAAPDITVERPTGLTPESPTRSASAGRLTVERLVTVKRQAKLDVRVIATNGNTMTSVVVPSMAAVTGLAGPQVQAIDGPRIRETVSFPVPVKSEPVCFPAKRGEAFDVTTIRVTASSLDGGYWKVTKREAEAICVEAGETAKPNPKAPPYAVILRVDKYRPRTATD
jgi:hypothetical protein